MEIQSKDSIARGFYLSRFIYIYICRNIIMEIIFVDEKKEEEESVKVVKVR